MQAANEKAKQAELLANTANQEKEQALAEKTAAVKRAETAELELNKLKVSKPIQPTEDNPLSDDTKPKIGNKIGGFRADGKTKDTKEIIYRNDSVTTSGSTYIYNLRNSGYVSREATRYFGSGSDSGRTTEISATYGGNPTLYSQLNKLKGDATYIGRARAVYSSQSGRDRYNQSSGVVQNTNMITLITNFTEKKISGKITNNRDYYNRSEDNLHNDAPEVIYLHKTTIQEVSANQDKLIGFSGSAAGTSPSTGLGIGTNPPIDYSGTYEGKFMGENAEEISGEFRLHGSRNETRTNSSREININGAFAAEKQ